MASEKFCLKWNDFENNISVAFRDLRDEKDFFDITLACEDSQIQAHKVILSACSPFFRNVLRNNPHQHPLIYLRGMKYSDLESVLNFMYHGEVNIAQEQLNSFLAVAEELRVKGLTQNQNGEPAGNNSKKRASSPTPGKSKTLPADPSGPPPSKRSRPVPPPQPPVIDDDDIQEVVPVKSEPKELVTPSISTPSSGPSVSQSDYHSQALVQHDEYTEENYGEYEQYDDQYLDTAGQQQESEKGLFTPGDLLEKQEDLSQYIEQEVGTKRYRCLLCSFVTNRPAKVRYHLEAIHFRGEYSYNCSLCQKTFQGRNALSCHMSQSHPQSGGRALKEEEEGQAESTHFLLDALSQPE